MQTFTRVANFIMIMMLLGMIMAVTGCSKTDENGQTVGQKIDKGIDNANARSAEAGKSIEQAADKAGDKIEAGAEKAKSAMQDAAASAKEKAAEITTVVDDSAITASVKADLLKDPALSALKVDVRTDQGAVTLTGNVDNENAKKRAEQVASAVSGVQKVNNQLQVAARKGKAGEPSSA